MRFQPYLRALALLATVGQVFPNDHSKNCHVPQSKASGLPPYLAHILSQTGLLSMAHTISSTSLS